jgi:hypothetical protein
MMFAISSLGLLCGPPISGAIIASKNDETDFVGAMLFAGTVSLVGVGSYLHLGLQKQDQF